MLVPHENAEQCNWVVDVGIHDEHLYAIVRSNVVIAEHAGSPSHILVQDTVENRLSISRGHISPWYLRRKQVCDSFDFSCKQKLLLNVNCTPLGLLFVVLSETSLAESVEIIKVDTQVLHRHIELRVKGLRLSLLCCTYKFNFFKLRLTPCLTEFKLSVGVFRAQLATIKDLCNTHWLVDRRLLNLLLRCLNTATFFFIFCVQLLLAWSRHVHGEPQGNPLIRLFRADGYLAAATLYDMSADGKADTDPLSIHLLRCRLYRAIQYGN